jgi:hypothetical protein
MSAEEASAEVRRMIADSPDNAALIASITG